MNTKIIFILGLLLCTFSGCIREGLEDCPSIGDVRIHVYVEKFRALAFSTQESEASFNTRISSLYYYLYKDEVLQQEGKITDLASFTGPSYTFDYPRLEFGDYRLIVIANCEDDVLSADSKIAVSHLITYPGLDKSADYFVLDYPFTVDCDCEQQYDAYLQRLHSVVMCSFRHLPVNISALEMTLENVSNCRLATAGYSGAINVVKRIELPLRTRNDGLDVVIGTFPSLPYKRSAYKLKVYMDNHPAPYYDQIVTDTLILKRNQLINITNTFNDGKLEFEISLDTEWNGSLEGGGTEVN